MKYEDLSEGIRTAIHDEWNNFSHELAMNSEDGRFSMMDIRKAFYTGVDSTLKHFGWHPASELPPVNENLISELVLCWCVDSTFHTLEPKLGRVWRGEWCFKDVKWWCYPPKEE